MSSISEEFGIVVVPIANPDARPILTERTLIRAFGHLVNATRAFAGHSLPNFTTTDNDDAFLVHANMYGRSIAFARLLAHEDRMSPLMPGVMTDITPELARSAQGLIRLLSKWFEQLPAHPTSDETHAVLALAVRVADKALRAGKSDSDVAQAIGRPFIADLARQMKLTDEACLERVAKVAMAVMPVWRYWLGGIEPTTVPRI